MAGPVAVRCDRVRLGYGSVCLLWYDVLGEKIY
jgi:hypothetical protein